MSLGTSTSSRVVENIQEVLRALLQVVRGIEVICMLIHECKQG